MTPPRDGGFTLLELLVALVVLGFILAGLAQGTQFGLLAAGSQARTVAERGDMDAVDRALTRLIQGMDPGRAGGPAALRGTASSLAFTSTLPDAAALPSRRADILLASQGGRLILRAVPRLPGPAPGAPPAETELLRGIERLEVSYWIGGPQPGWATVWTGRGLPGLIRLRLVFPAGDRRHWPDIVAAPMRAAAG